MLSDSTHLLAKLPWRTSRAVKYLLTYPRFYQTLYCARVAYRKYGDRCRFPFFFIAGLPKSGSSWLSELISACTNHIEILLPEATFTELATGQSVVFNLRDNCFSRLEHSLAFTKMHCHGSKQNTKLLQDNNIPYVVLYRDPRAVAVSYVHYVRRTPWHADYRLLRNASITDGISYFIRAHLMSYANWMRSWRENRSQATSLMVSYEQLRIEPLVELERILGHFGVSPTRDQIMGALTNNSLEKLRNKMPNISSFFREGATDGWSQVFNKEHRRAFNQVDAKILSEFGYANGDDW